MYVSQSRSKPTTGNTLSNLTKSYIKKSLDPYRVASLDIVITDPDIMYIELDSLVYFDEKRTLKDAESISATVRESLNRYVTSTAIPKFGGALSYSKLVCIIDESEKSITRNNTDLILRKDLRILPNNFATYEVCVDQEVKLDRDNKSVYSTGFQLEIDNQIDERIFYFENDPDTIRFNNKKEERLLSSVNVYYLNEFNRKIWVDIYESDTQIIKIRNVPRGEKNKIEFGKLYYDTGELELGFDYTRGVKIVSTQEALNVIEVRFVPAKKAVIVTGKHF